MPPKQNNDQDHFVRRVQAVYQQDYTKWLVYGRKRGLSDEVIIEAIQETSLKVLDMHEKLCDFDDLTLHAYIMTAFKNTMWEILRNQGSISLDDDTVCDDISPEELVINQIEYEKLSQMVKKLSPQYQQYIYLRYYLCLSSKMIGEQMGIKENAVRTIKHRAISMLRRLLSIEEGSGSR